MAKQNYTNKEKDKVITDVSDFISDGMPIYKACLKAGISKKTYLKWISESDQYARLHSFAMQDRADAIFEEILNIADATKDDVIEDDNGNKIINHNVIQRDRLRVDSRKWIAGKLNPKKYGDKVDVTSGGDKIQSAPTSINIGIVKPLED